MTESSSSNRNGDEGASSSTEQHVVVVDEEEDDDEALIIPLSGGGGGGGGGGRRRFVEIFPEELVQVDQSTIIKVLRDEDAPLSTYADAASIYMSRRREREGHYVLSAASRMEAQCSNKDVRVRVLASAGIACLTQTTARATTDVDRATGVGVGGTSSRDDGGGDGEGGGGGGGGASDDRGNDELRQSAEELFNKATHFDQFFPMTWVGKGMLNLSINRLDSAKFFFDTTMKQYGQVLPALLGKAAVHFQEGAYREAQDCYARAMTLYPVRSGAAARVGFGLCCYRLQQIDRAKAAFRRAHRIDPENVEALVGCAVLDLASVDAAAKNFSKRTESAIKLISKANIIDHGNAMVQNHLANHYFWKWSQVPGTVSVEQGSCRATGSQPIPLDPGERVRIGQDFETVVAEDDGDDMDVDGDNNSNNTVFRVKDVWKKSSETGLKLWKKDYDRVTSLAKGAYSSTNVKEIQAESLFILARVHHVRRDHESARNLYDKACKLAPQLSPARFGLAQVLLADGQFDDAVAHLRLVLGTSSAATDALAVLGLLEARGRRKDALAHLKRAVESDPLNAELVLLEAFALRQEESDYPEAIDRYRKAVGLLRRDRRRTRPRGGKDDDDDDDDRDGTVPYEVWTNIGVLCHETKRFDEALDYYAKALETQGRQKDEDDAQTEEERDRRSLERECFIQSEDNRLFWKYVRTNVEIQHDAEEGGSSTLTVTTAATTDSSDDAAPPSSDLRWLRVGDHVRLGDDLTTTVLSIDQEKGRIRVKDVFVPPPAIVSDDDDDADGEGKPPSSSKRSKNTALFVKRENGHLERRSAITITFNLARLHEAAGRILAAIELHKAILRKHPSYVNSYLRLACIARDSSSIKNCSEWLRRACEVAPGNTEVLSLVGNLHLSLCDWEPAQRVFTQLVNTKDESVRAFSQLSLGNIYFNNLHTAKKYNKHLVHAASLYSKILEKDDANAYAANGLGTILAEKGELLKAKEVFNRVREISGDTIPDTLLNLGHIYLAQKKHPEAVQMYRRYMDRTTATGAPVTSRSQDDNEVEVLGYVAFAYFDWAKQTELFNNARAADADGRYRSCVEALEDAMRRSHRENVVLRYNWCRAKLQAANCVLQKLQRNIRRTAKEVRDALDGLEQSLPMVRTLLQWKGEGKRIPIATTTLNNFVTQCQENIEVARSHLSVELKKESDMQELMELQRRDVAEKQEERELEESKKRKLQLLLAEEQERKARAKMQKVNSLAAGWDRRREEEAPKKRSKKGAAPTMMEAPTVDEDVTFDNDVDVTVHDTKDLFDDSDADDSDNDEARNGGGGDDDDAPKRSRPGPGPTPKPEDQPEERDLFGDSSDEEESDEELIPNAGVVDAANKKKVLDDDDDDD